jgi:hypothetical protein
MDPILSRSSDTLSSKSQDQDISRNRRTSSKGGNKRESSPREKEYLNLSRKSSVSDIQVNEHGAMRMRSQSGSGSRRRTSSEFSFRENKEQDEERLNALHEQPRRRRSSVHVEKDELSKKLEDLEIGRDKPVRRKSTSSASQPNEGILGMSPSKRNISKFSKVITDLSATLPSLGKNEYSELFEDKKQEDPKMIQSFGKKRGSLMSKRNSNISEIDECIFDNEDENFIKEEFSQYDTLAEAMDEISHLIDDQRKKADFSNDSLEQASLIMRLEKVYSLLKSIDIEESMLRAEQIEKAMVAEVMDYESSFTNQYNESFASWISKSMDYLIFQLSLTFLYRLY